MVAQCKAGDTIRFVETDIETAQDAFLAQREKYRRMREFFDAVGYTPAPIDPMDPSQSLYRVHMDDKVMEASIQLIEE